VKDLLNVVTRWVVIGPWLLWLAWELVLLYLRTKIPGVKTISQEARSIAFRGFPTLAYFWCGMASHWFIPWRRPLWPYPWNVVLGVAFWAIGAAYLAADIFDPRHQYWPTLVQWIRWPPLVALLGLVLGYLLFPQTTPWVPGGGK
jgi:hypothetical protein